MDRVAGAGLQVANTLKAFIETEALPGTGLDAAGFWPAYAGLLAVYAPRNAVLLQLRDALQARIDDWHRAHRGKTHDAAAYTGFLREIGYIQPEPPPFSVGTENVDAEIARIAGPRLVVPVEQCPLCPECRQRALG